MKTLRWLAIALIIILLEAAFRVAVAQAQPEVCIPHDVAAFFLERSDLATVYEIQLKAKNQIIANLEQQLITKDLVVVTYVSDADLYKRILETKDREIALKDDAINSADKRIKKMKTEKILTIVACGVILLLAN